MQSFTPMTESDDAESRARRSRLAHNAPNSDGGTRCCASVSSAAAILPKPISRRPAVSGFFDHGRCDLRTEAAAGLASRFNLRALKVDDMMRSDEIDLVLNLTVPAAHAEISLNAIEAGKHVFLKSRWRRRSMAPSGSTGPPATGMSGLALPRTRFSDPPPRMPAA